MKKTITNTREALIFQLQGLYYAETKLIEQFNSCKSEITSEIVKKAIEDYIISEAKDRLLKLERVFNHLAFEPLAPHEPVILKLIEEVHNVLSFTTSSNLKDIMVISCLQKINAFKIATLKTARLFALEIELNETADIIHEVLTWERTSTDTLDKLVISAFNISHEFEKYNLSV